MKNNENKAILLFLKEILLRLNKCNLMVLCLEIKLYQNSWVLIKKNVSKMNTCCHKDENIKPR